MATASKSKKSVWNVIVGKAFPGNKGIKIGRPNCLICAGVPTNAAPQGTLCWDSTNSDTYMNTDGSTTWTKIQD